MKIDYLPLTLHDGNMPWECRLYWSSTPNYDNDTSTVIVNIQARKITNTTTTYNNWEIHYYMWSDIEQKDLAYAIGKKKNVSVSSNNWTTIEGFSFTAKHDNNGECAILADVRVYSGGVGASTTRDDALILEKTIKEATITSAENFNDEESPTITYSNPMGDSSKITSLQACIANETGGVVYIPYRDIDKTGSSYTFFLTDQERNNLREICKYKESMVITFFIRTYIDDVEYRSFIKKTFTVVDAAPTVSIAFEDINAATTALTGNSSTIVKGVSNLSYTVFAAGQKYANIDKCTVSCGTVYKEHLTGINLSGVFSGAAGNSITATVVDSRGKSSTETIYLDTVDYVKPTCVQTVSTVINDEDESNSQVVVNVKGNYFDGDFGEEENTIKIEIRHTQNDGTMGDWVDITPLIGDISNNTYTLTNNVSGLDVSGSYTFQSRITDKITSATSEEYTVKFSPVFDWSGTDFNFNVPVSINGGLGVSGDFYIGSDSTKKLVDYVIANGQEAMGTNGTWYWQKWKNGKSECWGMRNFGRCTITTANNGLYTSDEFTQNFPTNLFTSAPHAHLTLQWLGNTGNIGFIATGAERTLSSRTMPFKIASPVSHTASASYIDFYVVGRWK